MAVGVGALLLVWAACSSTALAAGGWKVVLYRHARVTVPRAWSVYDLSSHPEVCVRFDRHAVYLGVPSADQRCPAQAVGRTEAILLGPRTARTPAVENSSRLALGRDVVATATWGSHPQVIERALGVGSRRLFQARTMSRSREPAVRARIQAASTPGAVYTGRGFDACSAPSESQMAAWASSHMRGVGVYIGGVNMACSQPNLTAGWVSDESAAGWHLIPTYVGLQSPGNSCGCAAIDPHRAASEGAAAASDAVAQAQALGLGPGNPIYFDMEPYPTGRPNSPAVLAFLSAWTTKLHAKGYESGVYSTSRSGISDLATKTGTAYPEPDDIWFAEWNGERSTASSYIPSDDWADHERLHQYEGGHNETHGGVTINIDSDYLDGATAAEGSTGPPPPSAPQSTAPPSIAGRLIIGQTLSASRGSWSGTRPISYRYQWQRCHAGCVPIPGATLPSYTLASRDAGASVRVVVRASNVDGRGRAHSHKLGPVVLAGPAYWLFTGRGNVYSSAGTPWYGSPVGRRVSTTAIVGMASTPDGRGYWLLASTGAVYDFGDASPRRVRRHRRPVKGIVASPEGGYWLYTAQGDVYADGTRSYGSPVAQHIHTAAIVGMAATPDGRGYWLVSSTGVVYHYGDAGAFPLQRRRQPIEGIVASRSGGYWLYTARGDVYRTRGAPGYGSLAGRHAHVSNIVGMAATADRRGYWLVTSRGIVYAYGDAAPRTAPHPHAIKGIAG